MRQRNVPDVEDCVGKIEALLKEYNCELAIDRELDGKLILVDLDTEHFELLPFTTDCVCKENSK